MPDLGIKTTDSFQINGLSMSRMKKRPHALVGFFKFTY